LQKCRVVVVALCQKLRVQAPGYTWYVHFLSMSYQTHRHSKTCIRFRRELQPSIYRPASKFQNIVPTGHIENQKRWRELCSGQIIRGMTSLVDTQSICKCCKITDACMTSSCATWHYVAFIASFCRVIEI
jgi:hypothetical protein